MIVLQFSNEPDRLADISASIIEKNSYERLRYNMFELPITFQIDGNDLFRWQTYSPDEPNWMAAPVIDVAMSLSYSIDEAWEHGFSQTDIAEVGIDSLQFVRTGENILIRSRYSGTSALATYRELRNACDEFFLAVRQLIITYFPSLVNHPELGMWLTNGIAPDV